MQRSNKFGVRLNTGVKQISVIPGVTSFVSAQVEQPLTALSTGNLLIIDTLQDQGFAIGSGALGTISSGKDTLYQFSSSREFQQQIVGGGLYALANILFNPGSGDGISTLTYINAASTTPASLNLTFDNGDTLAIRTLKEALNSNGVITGATTTPDIAATGTITITNPGADTDTIQALVSGSPVGNYTVQAGDDADAVATGLAASIASGYSATALANVITITADTPGSAENGNLVTVSVTGAVTATTTDMSGGADATSTGGSLTSGYSARLSAGVIDTDKYVLTFYRGEYRGDDSLISLSASSEIEVSVEDSPSIAIAQSPELETVQEIVDWMTFDSNFLGSFELTSSTATGSLAPADLVNFSSNQLFAGATSTFSTAALDEALDAIADHKVYDAVLLLEGAANATGASNVRIFNAITQDFTQVQTSLIVAGYDLTSNLLGDSNSSEVISSFYNNDRMSVVHGYISNPDSSGVVKRYNALATASYYVGTRLGLPSQVPATFKNVSVLGSWNPNQRLQEAAIVNGIITLKEDGGQQVWLLDTNSLQNNALLLNQNTTTRSNQLIAIVREIRKTIDVDLKNTFLKNPNGANRFTVSNAAVASRIETLLQDFEVTPNADGLILNFEDVNVRTEQDQVIYGFCATLNNEINYIIGDIVVKL